MNKITIQDIAKAANVSKSTVSRVLNGSASVNPDKKKAVLEATKRLGFKPNVMAQSLASGKSLTIGVLTQLIGSPFFDGIAQGVILGLSETKYSPLFMDGRLESEYEKSAILALLGRRVDGMVIIGGNLKSGEISELCEDVPTVIVAREFPSDEHHCIYMNNFDGGYCATKHLVGLGHHNIAMIQGVAHNLDAIDRFKGYQSALKEAGIDFDENLVMEGDFSSDSGIKAINELCKRKQKFSAVFAANDAGAYGARLALHRQGLRVPEDVSIVGFDDQAESAFMTPPLTTVRQPASEMGSMAVKGVLSLLDGKPFESVKLNGELCVRESSSKLQSE